jgi:hypothetical protein
VRGSQRLGGSLGEAGIAGDVVDGIIELIERILGLVGGGPVHNLRIILDIAPGIPELLPGRLGIVNSRVRSEGGDLPDARLETCQARAEILGSPRLWDEVSERRTAKFHARLRDL